MRPEMTAGIRARLVKPAERMSLGGETGFLQARKPSVDLGEKGPSFLRFEAAPIERQRGEIEERRECLRIDLALLRVAEKVAAEEKILARPASG